MRSNKINKKHKQINIVCCLLCLLSVIIDQAVKLFIINNLNLHVPYRIFSFLNFFYTFNSGISFSMLNTCNSHVLILLSCLCLVLLVLIYIKFNNSIERIFLTLLIGGAIGNFIDRFVYGAVIDFIDLYIPKNVLQILNEYIKIFPKQYVFYDLHFPTFNVADSFITIGATGLIVYNLFKKNTSIYS